MPLWALLAACCVIAPADSAAPPDLTVAIVTKLAPAYKVVDSVIKDDDGSLPLVGEKREQVYAFAKRITASPAMADAVNRAGFTPFGYAKTYLALRDAWFRRIAEAQLPPEEHAGMSQMLPYATPQNVRFIKDHGTLLASLGFAPPYTGLEDD